MIQPHLTTIYSTTSQGNALKVILYYRKHLLDLEHVVALLVTVVGALMLVKHGEATCLMSVGERFRALLLKVTPPGSFLGLQNPGHIPGLFS